MNSPKAPKKKPLPEASPKTGETSGKLFKEWSDADDVEALDEIINDVALMIIDDRNKWVLPYLAKQLEAFELLRAMPLQK